jgi:MFS transporter, SHS family, lactate transporter
MALGAVLMGLVANSAFGIVPMYLARRFPAGTRGLGLGIGYAMTSLSVGAPYVIAVFTARWGLPVSMTTFIIVGAVLSAVIASFNTERWIPVPEVIEAGAKA